MNQILNIDEPAANQTNIDIIFLNSKGQALTFLENKDLNSESNERMIDIN